MNPSDFMRARLRAGSRTRRGLVFTPLPGPVPVTQATPPPAGSGAAGTAPGTVFESAARPPLRVFILAGSSGSQFTIGSVNLEPVVVLAPAASGGAYAPAVISIPVPVPPQPVLQAWQRDVQHWAVHQERQRHAQALWQYGELAVFILMWTTLEEKAGLVQRCLRCFQNAASTPDTVPFSVADVGGSATLRASEARIASAYGGGNQYRCPDCFGTQFEGGFRALIVRPAVFTDLDKNQQKTSRGVVNTAAANIESTPDFRVRAGDYCFRQDGMRFRLRVPRRTTLRTGFALPYQQSAAIDYNLMQADLEDPTSVAYSIPPSPAAVAEALGSYTRLPVDFSWFEIIRAPLITEDTPTAASSGNLQASVTYPLSGAS